MASTQTASTERRGKAAPALKLNFLSHGTLESRDLAFSRRFYKEFLGLEVVQTSPISLLIGSAARTRSRSSTARMSAT
jgi:catechol-2,3-dioxygenase